MSSVSGVPPIYFAKWAAISHHLTPVQILQSAVDSIPHLRHCIQLQTQKLIVQTTKINLVLNVFNRCQDPVLFEFQRLSGDRSVFRFIARAIYSSLILRDPDIELCSENSFLLPPKISKVYVQEDCFAQPILDCEPSLKHQEASMELVEVLLHSARSPFLEVHHEALLCLAALSFQSSSAQALRQITDQVIPVLCLRLKSHDTCVSSLAARIGINIFGNGVAAASLSASEQSSLCRALIRKMKERSAPVDSAIESLYDVMKQSFGMKMSPPICT